ncbi:MAG TPA: C25 family cysteine peptidase, partial [Phycisphaerae bacterium]|nr:C25 family cysteine peptidase [Phycisphaerae bacterium]
MNSHCVLDVVRRWAAGRRVGLACLMVVILVMTASFAFGAPSHPGVVVTVQESTPAHVVLQYDLGSYASQSVTIKGAEYTLVTLGKEAPMLVTGAPELPHVCRSIIIPDDAEMSLAVTGAEYQDIEGVDVAPSKGNLPRTVNPEDVPYTFGTWYAVDAFYPGEVATLGEPYILRDYRGVVVDLKPFQYNPVKRTLRVYKSVTVEVSNVGRSNVNVLDQLSRPTELSLAFHNLYQVHFLNYNPGPRYAPLDEVGGMLIICYDSWLPNVAPLVEHKNSAGIPTTAVGVSTIPGGTSSSAIANYIQSQYTGGNLAFVLLVGDSAQVATPSAAGGSSDPTYSLVAGTDNYPDIMVGRFSAETSGQVDTQVQRSVEYENMPATQQAWFWKGTGIGSEYGTGDDGEYDWQHIDNIRTLLLAHGYTLVDQLYGTTGATAAQVTAALNAGRGIINYCGHGSSTSWGTTGFSSSDVAALTNDNMLPFIFSVACVNGQFAGGTCFAEAWLRSTHAGEPVGAVGTYMSSINQDWNPPMQAQDEFDALYCAATPTYNCYGTLCYAGSCSMMDSYGSSTGSSGANMFLTWHVFGDPSLRIIGVVEPPTGLKVAPADDYAAGGPVGGPFAPASKVYTLTNKNSTPLSYSVTKAQPWLTITNGSGTLPALGTADVTVTVNTAANSLAHGNYGDTISIVNLTDHDGDTARDMTLQVGGAGWDPVATGKTVSASAYAPTDIDLNATDPNGDPLTFEIEVLPAAGQGILLDPGTEQQITTVPYTLVNGGRVVRYVPPFGQTLSTTFTFAAWDATARSNLAVVVVNV